MLEHESRSAQPTELFAIIAEVRRRWRFKLALRGLVRVVIVAMLLVAREGLSLRRLGDITRTGMPPATRMAKDGSEAG